MPTRRIKDSERRRCAKACLACKRRKERCDGRHPCGRCTTRGVASDCAFTRLTPSAAALSLTSPTTSPDNILGDQSEASQSQVNTAFDGNGATDDMPLIGMLTTACNNSVPAAAPAANTPSSSGRSQGGRDRRASHSASVGNTRQRRRRPPQSLSSPQTAPIPQLSRLIQDGRGKSMFVGDAANLSFLQIIRRIVNDALGPCAFTDDPMRTMFVEATPEGRPSWVLEMAQNPPPRPDTAQGEILLNWYIRATKCVFDLFEEADLRVRYMQWLRAPHIGSAQDVTNAIFFLVSAIGALACPEDRDQVAEKYFNYGRFCATASVMEDPSIGTVQSQMLIAKYLLCASRRNAAFMYIGTAVHAAYALGIHRSDINLLFDPTEFSVRERAWRVLRIQDLFLSASLGRPPSTAETRDTMVQNNYSASNDMCAIFEAILTEVYSKRMVSTEALEKISNHHRQWALRYTTGLATDAISPGEFIEEEDGTREPNIGLYHLKEAYYWTIMLLARPFLIESVSRHVSLATKHAQSLNDGDSAFSSPSDQVLGFACVDSAIRTIDLLRGLLTGTRVPKRLPFVVNSVFVAALVLGLALFGDLDSMFPVEKSLWTAQRLLALFSRHDPVARRDLIIVENIQTACDSYLEKRARRKMERQSQLIGGLFGTLHSDLHGRDKVPPGSDAATNQATMNPAVAEVGLTPVPDAEEGNSVGCVDSMSSSIEASAGGEGSAFLGMGDHGLNILAHLSSVTDMILPMSPRTLMFDSFDQSIPLFCAMPNVAFEQDGDWMMDSELVMEPQS